MLIVSLPIADRRKSFDFYRDGLDLAPIGEAAEDGIPEPLQFAVGDGARIMLIPTGGFEWAIGDRPLLEPGSVGCLLSIGASSDTEVDEIVHRAEGAGASVIVSPTRQPWGMYAATFADPDGHLWLVTSTPAPGGQ